MSKYIDAEKLIAEIERRKKEMVDKGDQTGYHDAEIIRRSTISTCNDLLSFIDSLQQEQPEIDLEKEIDTSIRLMPGAHSLEGNEQWYKGRYEIIKELALYFYKLGLNARKA